MSFTADWLALRHAADLRARNAHVAGALSTAFERRPGLRVVDIGAGTGANLRATAPLLPKPQHWRLVDQDPVLLGRAEAPEGVSVETHVADLAGGVAPLLEDHPDLVTASAFFDLAGADWLDRFVADLTASGAALFAVLTYDGHEDWEGVHPEDDAVHAAFLADQRRDKGLGPALGPEAHGALVRRLREAGYSVTEGPSPWRLTAPGDAALIAALAEGKAAGSNLPTADDWAGSRRRARAVEIGHRDLVALPPRFLT